MGGGGGDVLREIWEFEEICEFENLRKLVNLGICGRRSLIQNLFKVQESFPADLRRFLTQIDADF